MAQILVDSLAEPQIDTTQQILKPVKWLWNIVKFESNFIFTLSLRSCLPWDICKYLSAFETLNKTAFLEVPFVHFFINTSYQDQTKICNDNGMPQNLIIHVTS